MSDFNAMTPFQHLNSRANEDVTGLGVKHAAEFNANVDSSIKAYADANQTLEPQLLADNYDNTKKAYAQWLINQGYTKSQREQMMSEWVNTAYNPYERSWGEVFTDTFKQVGSGTTNLFGSAASGLGFDGVADSLWQTADELNKEQSTSIQLQSAAAEQQYQNDVASGMNSAVAAAKMYADNPRLIGKLAAEQLPQLGLAAIPMVGGAALVGTNVLAGGGNVRKAVREAWENMPYEDALNHPLMQARLKQGMNFPQALEDVKNDYSDNALSILFGYAIGGEEAATPLAKLGKGINKSVTGTIAKEIGVNALQGGAEQVNQNLAVRSVDDKTNWNDDLGRSMVEEGIGGAAFSPIVGYDAYRNGKAEKNNGTQSEQSLNTDEQEIQQAGGGESDDEQVTEVMSPMAERQFAQPQPQQAVEIPQNNANAELDQDALEYALANINDDDRELFQQRLARDITSGKAESRNGKGKYDKFVQAYLKETNTPVVAKSQSQPLFDENNKQGEVAPEIPQPTTIIQGVNGEIELGSQGKRPFEYQLVEADELTVNLKPNAYQDRDRTSVESQAQIMDYANNLNPSYLGASVDVTQGAPTVDEQYGVFAGNGRLSAIKQAYAKNPEKATAYRDYLAQNAGQFGLTAEQVAGMKQPVLVRKMTSPIDVRKAVKEGNFNTGLDKGVLGNAKDNAQYITDDLLDLALINEDGSLNLSSSNDDFIQGLVANIPVEIRPKFFAERKMGNHSAYTLTAQGRELVENALLVKAYSDGTSYAENLLTDLITDISDSNKRVKTALISVAGKVIQTKGTDYDIAPSIIQAYDLMTKGKKAGLDVSEAINQGDMLNPPSEFVKGLVERFYSPKSVVEVQQPLNEYLNKVINSNLNNTQQDNMFGDDFNPSREELLRESGMRASLARNNANVDSDIEQARTIIEQRLGKEYADRIDFKRSSDFSANDGRSQSEGFFENDKVHLIVDNIQNTPVMNRAERMAWVAWHEFAHNGIDVKFGEQYEQVMTHARSNAFIRRLTKIKQAEYRNEGVILTENLATEESLVELYAAIKTGNWDEIADRYGVHVSQEWKSGERKARLEKLIDIVARALRNIASRITGKDLRKASIDDVLGMLKQVDNAVNSLAENSENQTASSDVRYSLNERSDSAFASAVDEVVNGNVSRGYIAMGTTPDVLKMLGLPDTKIRIQGKTIEKVMGEYLGIDQGKHSHLHNLTPETLKRLPQNINNPVAVFNSSTRKKGYVVLTELTETDNRTGKAKPVIAALHLKPAKGGVEIIDIASVYGRSQGQLKTAFDEELLYLNKEKAQRLNTERLQLSWDFTSDVELSARNVKIESDLSQYQAENSTRYSFAGRNAKTVNHSLLAQAEQDLASGKNPEQIRKNTGWFKGVDGKWRFEIDDSQITFKRDWDKSVNASGVISSTEYSKGYNATATVGDILNAPELFAAYPDLADIKLGLIEDVANDEIAQEASGLYYQPFNSRKEHILLNGALPLYESKSVLLHELQHAIQYRENFTEGVNPKEYTPDVLDKILPYEKRKNKTRMKEIEQQDPDFVRNYNEMQVAIMDWLSYDGGDPDIETQLEKEASILENQVRNHPLYDEYAEVEHNSINEIYDPYDAYWATAGEVEARNVQTRMNMTAEERQARSPESTEDVNRDAQIVHYGDGVVANSLDEKENSARFSRKHTYRFKTSDVKFNDEHKGMYGFYPNYGDTVIDIVEHSLLFDVFPELGNIGIKTVKENLSSPENKYGIIFDKEENVIKVGDVNSVSSRANAVLNYLKEFLKSQVKEIQDNAKAEIKARKAGLTLEQQYDFDKSNGLTHLTLEQYKQTRSSAFKKFFKGSKVVDENTGEPLVLYHGSTAIFNEYDANKMGRNGLQYGAGFYFTDDKSLAEGYSSERGEVQEVYLNISKWLNRDKVTIKPVEIRSIIRKIDSLNGSTAEDGFLSNFKDVRTVGEVRAMNEAVNSLLSNTNDVDLIDEISSIGGNKETMEAVYSVLGAVGGKVKLDSGVTIYVALTSQQIKSATRNQGTFDRNNPDIRYSRRPKSESLEKLRKAETIRITGKEIEPSEDLRQYKRNALEYGKSLRGTYVNKDTGRKIDLGAGGVKEVLQHDYKNPDHLQSIAAIPQIIEQATYIDTLPNEETDKNFAIDEYEYYVAGLNIGGTDYTVKAVVGVSKDGDRYYDHKLSEIEKGDLLSLPSRITNPVGENNSPLSEIDDKRLLQILQDENAENTPRYSRKRSALDIANAKKVRNHDDTFWKHLRKGDWAALKKDLVGFSAKLDEWITDSNRPVIDWVMAMKKVSPKVKATIIGRMQRATGLRDAVVSDLESRYLKPIQQDLAKLANEYFDGDVETTMNKVGFWISARWAVEKNAQLLAREEQAMNETEQAYNDAIANKEPSNVLDRLERAFIKAENQYYNRKADVESRDFSNNRKYKVGVAGGWSSPLAQEIMRVMEKQIPRSALEAVAEKVYDLNQVQLKYNLESGRYTQAEYDFYIQDRHYVPLTGPAHTPDGMESDTDVDFFSMPGGKSVNTAKDKTLKGRVLSEADNAITAVWESVAKTATYSGWADFKHALNEVYEEQVQAALANGMSQQEALAEATRLTGITKQKMQGTTRTNDNVLVRKENGQYYEYRIPDEAINALKSSNQEYSNWLNDLIAKPTRWYARGVTQFTATFAFTNMVRDTWEKSEFIRVQEMFDKNGNPLSDKQKDAIGRALIANAVQFGSTWRATKRYAFGQELQNSDVSQRYLKELIAQGGISTHSTFLAKKETDLIKQIERNNRPLAKRLQQALEAVEGWNAMFDTVSSLSAYQALREAGIDKEQAASITLELTNFRKTGSALKAIKGLYMFAQPTAMGGRNLAKYLSTKHGQKRFVAYLSIAMVLYSALRALSDEDEGGNELDKQGDIDRYIPIPSPFEKGKYIKIPVGFGMPQMAWSFATNLVKAGHSHISIAEAVTNMFMHTVKATVPVSPSEISAEKYPIEKAALTATPSIFQPIIQIALNRNAFGSPITTGFVSDKKLKADQAKANTAPFWKETALWLSDAGIADMHPEQLKALWDGYSGMLGSLREVATIMIENPNRERLGKVKRIPFLNTFYGSGNEYAIQSLFYQATEEARAVHNSYTSRKERGTLPADWLTPERKAIVQWIERVDKETQEIRKAKAKVTKAYNDKKISEARYQLDVNKYDRIMETVQRRNLHKWRKMQGLNTSKPQN